MNPNSLFYEANQFILPQTSLYDFFDYLAGHKLDIVQQKPLSQTLKITFKHIDSVPKQLYLNRKFTDKDQHFKPIFLREIKDELRADDYPVGNETRHSFKDKQSARTIQGKSGIGSEKKQSKPIILQSGQKKRVFPNSTDNRNVLSVNANSSA